MNIYIVIIGILIIILGSISSSCFKNLFKSRFTPVNFPDIKYTGDLVPTAVGVLPKPTLEQDTHFMDSRYQYRYNPPVNPNVARGSVIKRVIPASPDLYFTQTYDTHNTLIDSPPVESTNELYFSGGLNQLIQIPLQYNDPYEPEQLRSQDILITPYNRIKYSIDPPSNSVF